MFVSDFICLNFIVRLISTALLEPGIEVLYNFLGAFGDNDRIRSGVEGKLSCIFYDLQVLKHHCLSFRVVQFLGVVGP